MLLSPEAFYSHYSQLLQFEVYLYLSAFEFLAFCFIILHFPPLVKVGGLLSLEAQGSVEDPS